MGQKVNPIGLRLGINQNWKSRWFAGKGYAQKLREDLAIRKHIFKKLRGSGVADIQIERSANQINCNIVTSKPGLIIGRGGAGIDAIKKDIEQKIIGGKDKMRIEIEEVRQPDSNARLIAQNIAALLEKKFSFRRVLKQYLDKVMQTGEVQGVKLYVSGRLNGAEMSRTEWLSNGKIPLHTLRASIDYAHEHAYTTYGTLGIKVWVYKGEVFEKEEKKEESQVGL